MWSTNCVRHSFRGYVQNILAPEFVWIRITWDASQAATVDRGSGRKLMQNHREVSRWSGEPDLQSHFAFLSMQIHPICKAVRHQMIEVIKSNYQSHSVKSFLASIGSKKLTYMRRFHLNRDQAFKVTKIVQHSIDWTLCSQTRAFSVDFWSRRKDWKSCPELLNTLSLILFCHRLPTVSETSQWKVKTRN